MTTADYFLELKEHHYSAFLDWPRFLVNVQYPLPKEQQHAECVVMILMYEWLNYGFKPEHYEPVYLLAHMYFNNQLLMPEGNGYAITLLATVIVQALIIEASGLFKPMTLEHSPENIVNHMRALLKSLPDTMNDAISQQQFYLNDWAKKQMPKQDMIKNKFLEDIAKQGKHVVVYGRDTPSSKQGTLSIVHQLEIYLHRLTYWSLEPSFNLGIRKGLVASLIALLNESDSGAHQKHLASYVRSILQHQPEEWEKDFLSKIYQPSILSRWWDAGRSIFGVLGILSQPHSINAEGPTAPNEPCVPSRDRQGADITSACSRARLG